MQECARVRDGEREERERKGETEKGRIRGGDGGRERG
ncbi:hypothetical protein chiPu_0028386, partial [Chiloscyllium punctatum]|nr:hypothetical protein [Chiloscyllium punctatum]